MQRQELVKVFNDTKAVSRKTTSGSYKQSEKWDTEEDIPPYDTVIEDAVPSEVNVQINVVNGDTLTAAQKLIAEGLEPLVLNMASDYCPGGGVAKGSRAQEEEIFRCTNYDQCSNRKLYPIGTTELIVTENVDIIKDEDYGLLHDYVKADFIAIAALRNPRSNGSDYLDKDAQEIMRAKIDSIFRYAVYQEKDCMVLGALGCGAFHNPPKAVCALFKESLDRYGKYFRKIVFAVLSGDKNCNYDVFKSLANTE
jgi:uncharacterized protein (TIGR02452 family)